MRPIQSISQLLPVAAYFAVVLIPVLLFGYDGPWFGADGFAMHDRRPFPTRINPGMFAALDEWFAHRIGLRYPLVQVGNQFHIGLMRRPTDQHIFFGRDGWLYWTDDGDAVPAAMTDRRGRLRFTQPQIDRIDAQLRTIRDRFLACGIPVAVAISPNKQSIYPEPLFATGPPFPLTRLDDLLLKLSEVSRALVVDPRQSMLDAKRAHASMLLYPKTETHWNALGAFYGYAEIMKVLDRSVAIAHPEFLSIDNYVVQSSRYAGGDMAQRILFSPWRFPDEDVSLSPKQSLPAPAVTDASSYVLFRNPQGKGRLLMLGGSFTGQMVQFFSRNFEEVHLYPSHVINGPLVARHRPDAMVYEMAERHASRLLSPPLQLDKICER